MPVYDCGDPDCGPCKTAFRKEPERDGDAVDQIENALADSFDIDWTAEVGALAVYDALREAGHLKDAEGEGLEAVSAEKARICRALGQYARLAPLDLKSPGEIQRDLIAILGERHGHVASIGSDECGLCGHDLRHGVHIRSDGLEGDQ